MVQSLRSQLPETYQDSDTSSNSKRFLILFLFLVLLGGGYLFVRIELMMVTNHFDGLLNDEVVNTNQYAQVTSSKVRQQVMKLAKKSKFKPSKIRVYVTLQPKSDFTTNGAYYKRKKLQGFRSVSAQKTKHIPGCSMQDALPPHTTLQDIVKGNKGNRNIMNRFEGVLAKDARAAITGGKVRKETPDNTIILAVDILVRHKIVFFSYKMWFHRRCFFYEKRRPYLPSTQIQSVLK